MDARTKPKLVEALAARAVEAGWGDFRLRWQLGDYLSAVAGGRFTDLTAVLVMNDSPCAIALANDAYGRIGYFGRPLFLAVAPSTPDARGSLELTLFEHFRKIALDRRLPVEFVTPRLHDPLLGTIGLRTLSSGGTLHVQYRAVVDITQSDDEIWRDIRRRFRTHINWGRQNLDISIVNSGNPDRAAFDAFQAFHADVAGRQTRPEESWNEMFKNLSAGRAELILARLARGLCAGTFTNYGKHMATYATGVYDRSLFEKPISHWPMFLAIQRAKALGCRYYDIGEVFLNEKADPKERNIAFFKKGFTSRVEVHEIWQIGESMVGQEGKA